MHFHSSKQKRFTHHNNTNHPSNLTTTKTFMQKPIDTRFNANHKIFSIPSCDVTNIKNVPRATVRAPLRVRKRARAPLRRTRTGQRSAHRRPRGAERYVAPEPPSSSDLDRKGAEMSQRDTAIHLFAGG